MDIGQAQDLGELLAQANLHFVFGGINAVLRQAARLDVAIEHNHFMPALGNLLRGKQSRWSRPHNEYCFQIPPQRPVAAFFTDISARSSSLPYWPNSQAFPNA